MFVDYYSVLEISFNASPIEIKAAYKKQAKKWHPDITKKDTTKQMQLINEAKLILLDEEARTRYDIEYLKFKKSEPIFENQYRQKEESYNDEKQYQKSYEYQDYEIQDDILAQWIKNARKQAMEIIKETIILSKVGGKAAVKEAKSGLQVMLIMFVILLIIIFIATIINK